MRAILDSLRFLSVLMRCRVIGNFNFKNEVKNYVNQSFWFVVVAGIGKIVSAFAGNPACSGSGRNGVSSIGFVFRAGRVRRLVSRPAVGNVEWFAFVFVHVRGGNERFDLLSRGGGRFVSFAAGIARRSPVIVRLGGGGLK